MKREILTNSKILSDVNDTAEELQRIVSSADEKDLNTVPFEHSWTAAQVTDHVTRSFNGMAEFLGFTGKTADRKPDEKAGDFKALFLNFETKMKSPPFILPTRDTYRKDILLEKFENSVARFTDVAKKADPAELLDLPPLGEITKLEAMYFVLYHTQRHIHQLKNILEQLNLKK